MNKYLIIILALISGCSIERRQIPEECNVDKKDLLIDNFSKDTVIVEGRWLPFDGQVTVRNKYGKKYKLECDEYEKIK